MEIAIAAFLLLGLVIGTAAGWFFRSSRASNSEELLRDARTRLEQVDKERVAALDELRVESSRRASFEALSQRIPDLEQSLQYREQTILRHQQTILEGAREKEALAATIEAERRGFEAKQRLLEEAKAALSDAFGALSANALKSNSEQFVKLAHASVAPVRDALEKFEAKVQALEVAREGAYQGLVQQVTQLLDTGKELRSETANLVQALRAPVTRGQ